MPSRFHYGVGTPMGAAHLRAGSCLFDGKRGPTFNLCGARQEIPLGLSEVSVALLEYLVSRPSDGPEKALGHVLPGRPAHGPQEGFGRGCRAVEAGVSIRGITAEREPGAVGRTLDACKTFPERGRNAAAIRADFLGKFLVESAKRSNDCGFGDPHGIISARCTA